MTGSDKIEMTIKIGGERFNLTTSFNRQNDVRDAEQTANGLFEEFRKKFPSASNAAVMARVAYRLAASYLELFDVNAEAVKLASRAEAKLEKILSQADI